MVLLLAACSNTTEIAQTASTMSEFSTSSTMLQAPSATELDSSGTCRYLATSIPVELSRWVGSDDIANAPIGETRLGPQPDGGVPGVLTDGCVWEVRGPDGGHVGVAVERFVDIDIARLADLSADAAVTPSELADGRNRWDTPASNDSPSGAVLVGDASELVVVRVESHSDNADRTFVAGTLDGADRFFTAVGDEIVASPPD